MLNRVAVLSDIHGVLPALKAVLAEPEVQHADRIVVTGDICAGPQPVEVMDALLALGDQVAWLSGNADRELCEIRRSEEQSACEIPIDVWAAAQLRDSDIAFLEALPKLRRMAIAGIGEALFCHATPRNDHEVVVVDSRASRWTEIFESLDSDITTLVCGHTHMPFIRQLDEVQVINPGSVGMPYGRPGAHWALLGPGVTLRRTEFDYAAACAAIAAESSFPDAATWAAEYVRAENSISDAMAAFAPLDGR